MAQTFKFELVSPERIVFSGEAEQVLLPGSEGDMTILPGPCADRLDAAAG